MKKFLSFAFMLAFAGLVMTSCGGDSPKDGGDTDTTTKSDHKSEYFTDAVFASGGDFVGLSIGDSREDVMASLPKDAFADETDGYLYYEWKFKGDHDYYLDLYFDDNDKLNSIDGYVYFYDADGMEDKAEAKKFYSDMKDFFSDKYGSEEEEVDEDYVYTYWYMDEMDVEVGANEGEVYWYIYGYEDYDI